MYLERKTLPHASPSWVKDGAIYFITICAFPKRENQLCIPETASVIFDSIEFNLERGIWWPHLILLMPDHLHGLFSFAPEPGMTKAMADWKHFISRKAGISWQRDFFDHRLRRDESHLEKTHYIRQNPVRAGLANEAEAWPYVREWKTQTWMG